MNTRSSSTTPTKTRSTKSSGVHQTPTKDSDVKVRTPKQPTPRASKDTLADDKMRALVEWQRCLKQGLVSITKRPRPNWHAHFLLGLVCLKANEPEEARASFVKALEQTAQAFERDDVSPTNLEKWQACIRQHILQALILQRINSPAKSTESTQGIPDAEMTELANLFASSENPKLLNLVALACHQLGQNQRALDTLASAQASTLDPADVACNEAAVLISEKKDEDAERVLRQALSQQPHHKGVLVTLSALLCWTSKPVQVEALLNNVVMDQMAAEDAALLNNLACSYSDINASVKALEQAHRLDPDCSTVRRNLVITYLSQAAMSGSVAEQGALAQQALHVIDKCADSTDVNDRLCRVMVDIWMALTATASKDDPSATSSLFESRALKTAALVVEDNPNDSRPWEMMGYFKLFQGNPFGASRDFENVLSRDPSNARAWNNLALALFMQRSQDDTPDMGHHDEASELNFTTLIHQAQQCLDKAKDLDGQLYMAHNNLGNILREQGLQSPPSQRN
eukprot:c15518_g1_i3.p1 GENE.c15518_g1_i3~~c15518_g1_i3.p1  ORF type:complete len:514 (+),score=99.24 c15518_g1_i3:41-1582(+)